MERQSIRKSLSDIRRTLTEGGKGGIQTLMDITLVIDATGSMQNLMDSVKENALSIPAKFKSALEKSIALWRKSV